ncbi:phosphonate ABC transporter substrate-binding protein [Rhodovibrio sodomensis]|nr:phosphonate ABC transporter substrate-binding protein [Rhodovibrio sodomensis]
MNAFKKIGMAAAAAMIAVTGASLAQAQERPKFDLETDAFRIGIIGGENQQDRLRKYQCLEERFETLLGVNTKLFPSSDYAGTMEGLLGGNLDYAFLGSSGYAGIHIEDPDAVEPVLSRIQVNGSKGYHSIMLSRKGSGIDSIEDAKGKILGYADPNSTSGYLIPVSAFDEMGINPDQYFKKTVFSGGHEQNVLALLNGDVDVAVTWTSGVGEWEDGYTSGNLRKMVDKGMLDMSEIQKVWMSDLIPNGPAVLRTTLPQQVKIAVEGSLMTMPFDNPECFYQTFGGNYKGFFEVSHDFYQGIVNARKKEIEQAEAE